MEDYSKRCDLDNLISISSKKHKIVIDRAYKNKAKKAQMQTVLRECIEEYAKRKIVSRIVSRLIVMKYGRGRGSFLRPPGF